MSRLTKSAEECNLIPTATTNNKAAFAESISDGNLLSSSGGEENEKDVTLMLSRELALDINPKQSDLTASLILYGLYTWQVSKRKGFGYNPTINGKSACYRSLRELEADYPWLGHNSILKALRRAEKQLKGEFVMRVMKRGHQEQLHFLLSDELIKKYKFHFSHRLWKHDAKGEFGLSDWKRPKSGLISLQKSDAIKHGTLGAILINQLGYVIDPEHNLDPLTDEAGNIYRQLSPVKLTKPIDDGNGKMKAPLPVSTDTITRTLNDLKTNQVFHEHPRQNNYYTLVSSMKPLKTNAAEVTTDAAKGDTDAAEVTTHAAEVTSKNGILPCKRREISDLNIISVTSDRNTDGNADKNPDGKCLPQETSPLRVHVSCHSSNISAGAKMLNDLINQGLTDYRHKSSSHPQKSFPLDDQAIYQVEDEDKIQLSHYELPYEYIPVDVNTGKPYSRIAEIDSIIEEFKVDFRINGFPYTDADIQQFRALFIKHPLLTYDGIRELFLNEYFVGSGNKYHPAPSKGHDFQYFARRIKNLKSFLRYLPQLIQENWARHHISECRCDPVTGKPLIDYAPWTHHYNDLRYNLQKLGDEAGICEPYFTIAFEGDDKTPITYAEIPIEHEEEIQNWQYHYAKKHPGYKYFREYKTITEYEHRPMYYAEYVRKPLDEIVEYEINPMEPGYPEADYATPTEY